MSRGERWWNLWRLLWAGIAGMQLIERGEN